jgi:hypothetical protein
MQAGLNISAVQSRPSSPFFLATSVCHARGPWFGCPQAHLPGPGRLADRLQ